CRLERHGESRLAPSAARLLPDVRGAGGQGLAGRRQARRLPLDHARALAGGDRRTRGAEQGSAGEAESRTGIGASGDARRKAVGGGAVGAVAEGDIAPMLFLRVPAKARTRLQITPDSL